MADTAGILVPAPPPAELLTSLQDQIAALEANALILQDAVTIGWMFLNACLIFLMQLGFAMLEVGSVRVFHMQNILIKNVVDGAITVGAWFFFGYALYGDGSAFGGHKCQVVSNAAQNFLLLGMDSEPLKMADYILAVSFAASSVTIVSGAMAERCKLPAYFFFSACMGGIVYPLAAHWVWNSNGWLACSNPDKTFSNVLGYMDYAGGTVVHSLGGAAALVAVFVLGPRHGRFGIDGEVVELEGVVGNSGVYKVLGTLVLFVSWLSFNASAAGEWDRISAGALAGSNTVIAASFSCFTVMAWKTLYNRFEMNLAHSTDGLLAGCVGITAGAAFMEPWAAAIVGVVAGIIYTHTADAMLRFQLDDVVNAVAIHLTPGIWGAVAIGLFGNGQRMQEAYADSSFEPGVTYDEGVIYGGSGKLLGIQIFGALVIVVWSAIVNLPLFFLLRHFKVLRIPLDAQLSVHSGYKPRDTYQWSKYPKNPQIISLDVSNGGAPRPTQGQGTQVSQLNSQVLGHTQANPSSNGIHPPPSHSTASHIAPLSHNTNPPTSQPMSQTTY